MTLSKLFAFFEGVGQGLVGRLGKEGRDEAGDEANEGDDEEGKALGVDPLKSR